MTNKRLHAISVFVAAISAGSLALSVKADTLWTPADTTTAIWLDAADAGTVTLNAGEVSQWDDKSGNGRNATQATDANQPTYNNAAQNGLNVISFNGSTDFFDLGTGLDFLTSDATHTTFAVIQNQTFSNLYGAATGNVGDASLHIGFNNNGLSYRMNRWSNDSNIGITANYNAGQYNLLQWTWNQGGPKEVYANTMYEGTNGPAGSSLTAMAGGGRIMNVVGQGYMQADLGEFIIVHGTPDEQTVDQIEGYLAWKWGMEANLPADHPYKSAAPLVPEPSSLAALALLGLACSTRRRR